MILNEFKRILKREINSWDINERYTLHRKNYTVWDSELDVEYTHKTLDDALNFEIDGIKLSVLVENLPDDYFDHAVLSGSGGSSSGERMKVSGDGVSYAGSGNLHPSIRNTSTDRAVGGGRYKTTEDAIKDFDKAHRNSNIEYSITVDDNGYTHAYFSGDEGSTGVSTKKGMHVVHNHPTRPDGLAGGNMSPQDLKVFSGSKIKSMSAIDRDANYSIKKTSHFDAKGFDQAVKRLEKRGVGVGGLKADNWVDKYSKGMSKWLRVNQKRFGYEYTVTKHAK